MNNDDDRIAYLSGEDGVDVDDTARADLDELRDLLADDALWAVPSAGLEDSIVAAIAREAARAPGRARATDAGAAATAAARGHRDVAGQPSRPPHPHLPHRGRCRRRPRRRRRVRGDARSAATTARPSPSRPPWARAPAAPPTSSASESGWRILLDATGLPRLDDGRVLRGLAEGRRRRARADRDVQRGGRRGALGGRVAGDVLDPHRDQGAVADGNQDSSKQLVLSGTITLDDAATS